MASNTKNVKLGVCKVFFGGVDLGYTQGGVEVTVKTDTHKVNVDQFGKTPINEYIMGREVTVKVPLVETTLENMVPIMPGAVLTSDGVKATVTSSTVTGNFVATDAVTVDGHAFTFKAVPLTPSDVAIGATLAVSLQNLATAITASSTVAVTATATAATLILTAERMGVAGNSIVVSKATTGATFTLGTNLAGGVDATSSVVNVPTGIGTSLLAIAQRLVLHPIANADNDFSEDFTVFQAATAGALNFAYKLENERVYNCDFNGYPDPVSGKLFAVGNTGIA